MGIPGAPTQSGGTTPGGPASGGGGGSAGPNTGEVATAFNDVPGVFADGGFSFFRDADGFVTPLGETPTGDDGGSGRGTSQSSGSSWSGTYVNDALTAAGMAIQAFLSGQSAADARKLAAAEQFQSMAAWALPAGELPGGFQEGGAMQQLAARKGRANYMAPSRDSRFVNPGALEHPGQVSGEVMDFIDQLIGAAGKGGVVGTGGSSQQSSSS